MANSDLTVAEAPLGSYLMTFPRVIPDLRVSKIMPLLLSTYLVAKWRFMRTYLLAKCCMHFERSKLYSFVI